LILSSQRENQDKDFFIFLLLGNHSCKRHPDFVHTQKISPGENLLEPAYTKALLGVSISRNGGFVAAV